MRSSSLTRIAFATLGMCVVITPGCTSPSGPSRAQEFSVLSISPTEGSSAGTARVVIGGTGFQSGATVTVDGNIVNATFLNPNALAIAMPAHAAGKVDVTVIRPRGQARASVPGGYTYVDVPPPPPPPPPVISELLPNVGSTGGGTPLIIRGNGTGTIWSVDAVTIDGIGVTFESGWPDDALYLSTPPHAAGRVEVIVTDRYGQTASGVFTYAPPATFDFNGDWNGWAQAPPGSFIEAARLLLTVRDNVVVSVTCWVCRPGENCAIAGASAPSLTLAPPPVVANGEFSFTGSDGVSITGGILSPNSASGSITTASCGNRQWSAEKK